MGRDQDEGRRVVRGCLFGVLIGLVLWLALWWVWFVL